MTDFEKLLLDYATEQRACYSKPKGVSSIQTSTGFRAEFISENTDYAPETTDIPLEDLLGWMWGKISEGQG